MYYEPNSYDGPTESPHNKPAAYPGVADSSAYDHYTQAGDLYRLLSEEERSRLVANIVGAMKPVEKDEIKLRQSDTSIKRIPSTDSALQRGLV